jgi:Tfp pilus assembly protein PilO
MNKSDLVEKVAFKPHLKDYTYAVLFFLLSSFFAFFVIKPVLSIAFTLRREAVDLKHINSVYEKNVLMLVDIQSKMEQIRDRMYLIDDALPKNPQTKKLIVSINQAATDSGVSIKSISISPINLTQKNNETKPITLDIDVSGDFTQANGFIKALLNQRRVKTIESLKIARFGDGVDTGQLLRIQMTVQAYYL